VVVAVTLAIAVWGVLRGGDGSWYSDPFDRFPSGGAAGTSQKVEGAPEADRRLTAFLKFVVGDIQGFWQADFQRSNLRYVPAQVVVFRGRAASGCGIASSDTGPFYCPLDGRVYLDLGFFRELAVEFHAPGDFAQAYVLAHELGHHVQALTGVLEQVQAEEARQPEAAHVLSIATELQADCLAGVWGHSTYERRLLERGDLEEALRAAAAVGDDRIQQRTTGRIDPETWTHGSSEQRRGWYLRGFDAGDPAACDTFSELA
jgi:predicted metalloprotease